MFVLHFGHPEITQDLRCGIVAAHRAGLRQHCHGSSARVHPPTGLGDRHTLHAVDPALELEAGIDVAAADGCAGLLAAAALSL